MNINRTLKLHGDQYYTRNYKKDTIWLHHTAGTTARGAIDWWNQTPAHVGTSYVIDRDGTIYECFPPDAYAYHLGLRDDDNYHEKHGIGIEIVGVGPVHNVDGKFLFYPLYPNKKYPKVIPNSEVVSFKEEWRGSRHHQKYTKAQIKATCELIAHLVIEFKIPLQDTLKDFYQYNREVVDKHLPGIWSHSTVRKDKFDIVPHAEFMDELASTFKALKSPILPEAEVVAEKVPETKRKKKRKSSKN